MSHSRNRRRRRRQLAAPPDPPAADPVDANLSRLRLLRVRSLSDPGAVAELEEFCRSLPSEELIRLARLG
jgi:hypothetical protein